MASDEIVFDVEIAKNVDEVGGWANTHLMGVGVACVYEYTTDRFRFYGPKRVGELRERLLAADRVTSFNGYRFDLNVVFEQPRSVRIETIHPRFAETSNDILRRIWIALGFDPDADGPKAKGWRLEDVCIGTFAVKSAKVAHGSQAPDMFQRGDVDLLYSYVLDDVSWEKRVAKHVDEFGWVKNALGRQIKL